MAKYGKGDLTSNELVRYGAILSFSKGSGVTSSAPGMGGWKRQLNARGYEEGNGGFEIRS